jgi:coenzyme F420-reducing hydrogenase beta subunit
MAVMDNGDPAPVLSGVCRDGCRACSRVCPFSKGVFDPRPANEKRYSAGDGAVFHPNIGWHRNCLVGHTVDADKRRASASGGLLTWTLQALLRNGSIDQAGVVRCVAKAGGAAFEFFCARTPEELCAAAGSAYQPVEISGLLRAMLAEKGRRWAVVGVPCLCAALRGVTALEGRIPYLLGLTCGMYQNSFYTEMLLAESGVDPESCTNFEYRRKSDGGPPTDYRFRGTDKRGPGKEVPYNGLPVYLGRNAYFRLDACNYCRDVFAETADACFMDAWLPGYDTEPLGTSLVVVRNPAVQALLDAGTETGEIAASTIAAEQVAASQSGPVRRKQELIAMRLGTGTSGAAWTERLDWFLQRHAQARSKHAWQVARHAGGARKFWRKMAVVVAAQDLQQRAARIAGMTQRIRQAAKRLLTSTEDCR